MLIAHSITSSDFRSRLDQLTATRPDLEALLYLIGPDKMLEWAHTIGVATEAELAALAPPLPPVEMRRIVAAQSERPSSPLSGRNSTYRPVQICESSSNNAANW